MAISWMLWILSTQRQHKANVMHKFDWLSDRCRVFVPDLLSADDHIRSADHLYTGWSSIHSELGVLCGTCISYTRLWHVGAGQQIQWWNSRNTCKARAPLVMVNVGNIKWTEWEERVPWVEWHSCNNCTSYQHCLYVKYVSNKNNCYCCKNLRSHLN